MKTERKTITENRQSDLTSYSEKERAVILTNEQWNDLSCFLLMSTNFREGEEKAWRELSEEREKNGDIKYKNAKSNADFWKKMNESLETIKSIIDRI